MGYKCIGLLGDSIGQGYYANNNDGWFVKFINLLNQQNPKQYSYHNMAVSGERVTDVWHRLHMEAMTKELDTLFIAIGVNDLIRWGSPDTPTDVSEGLRNEMWRRILPTAKANINNIFVIGMLPVIEEKMPAIGAFDLPFYNLNRDIEKYNKWLSELCSEFDIPFINIAKAWEKEELNEIIHDESHPNDKGHQLIAEELEKQIGSKI